MTTKHPREDTQKSYKQLHLILKGVFWFLLGAFLGLFFFISFVFIYYQKTYKDVVYPGIYVDGVHFGGRKEKNIEEYFSKQNERIGQTMFVFTTDTLIATTSAKDLGFGYDADLLATQAMTVGRSDSFFSNVSLIAQAYFHGVDLPASYGYSEEKLDTLLQPIKHSVTIAPVNALFTFQNGKVTAFKPSLDGQEIDIEKLRVLVRAKMIPVITALKWQKLPKY